MTAIDPAWQSKAVAALLGPNHSALIPETLYIGWLDATDTLIEMAAADTGGIVLPHTIMAQSGAGVTNTDAIDAAECPATVPTSIGLYDALVSGSLIVTIPISTWSTTPVEGETLTIPIGALTLTYA